MEFNDIKIFVTVAKMESITKASEYLGYVQSHISKRIDNLEKELNCKLFKRTNRGVILLPKGEEFLSYSQNIISIMNEVEEHFKIKHDFFNIGTTQTLSHNYLSSLYLKKENHIFIRNIKELIQMYNQSFIDILILNRNIDNLTSKYTQTISEKICWIKSSYKKDNDFDKPIIISKDIDCPYRKRTIEYLNKYNREKINNLIEVDNLDILIKLVEKNEAIAILPYKSIKLNNNLAPLKSYNLKDIEIYVYNNTKSNMNIDILNLLEN